MRRNPEIIGKSETYTRRYKVRKGKISEAVLSRSVLKKIHKRREDIVKRPGPGGDGAAFLIHENNEIVLSSNPVTYTDLHQGRLAIIRVANNIAVMGAEFIGVMSTILLPEDAEESLLKNLMDDMEGACAKLGGEILGGHTEVTDAVNRPVVTLTGVGRIMSTNVELEHYRDAKEKADESESLASACKEEKAAYLPYGLGPKAGDSIIATKTIALEATSLLAKAKEEELKAIFPDTMVERAEGFFESLSIYEEVRAIRECPVHALHDASEGGIFGALWEMGSGSGLGFEVDIKKIPIRQETVEICEHFDLNPYMTHSSGSLLIVTPDGEMVLENLKEHGISAAIIGEMTQDKARKILNGEEVRYLDKPQMDELYKVM